MSNELRNNFENRDVHEFRSLFLTFGPKVRAMLMRQGADSATADDIVQDTMLTVWSKAHLFAPEKGTVSAWIYAIARNLRVDRVRRQIVWDQLRGEIENLNDIENATNGSMSSEPDRMYLANALSALPEDQYKVIQLSFMEGLSQSEIAEKLDVPLGTVKSRMRLAFDKLRCSVDSET